MNGRESESDNQNIQEYIMRSVHLRWRRVFVAVALAMALSVAIACGTETVVETVIVEKQVSERVVETVIVEKQVSERVVETVVVEKVVEGKTVMVVETVIVEKPVTERVVETVVVEKIVEGKTVMVVETVIVEKPVMERVVETVVVEKVVVATATPRTDVRTPSGILTIAVEDVGTPLYTNFTMSWPHNDYAWSSGILEGLTRVALDNWTQENELAEFWEISEQGGTYFLNVRLRKGVPFHQGYGEMTSEDVVWSVQDLMREGTKHTAFGSLDQIYSRDGITATDEYNVRFELKRNPGDFRGPPTSGGAGIISKAAYDKNGEDWSILNAVGTGPFEVIKHVPDNEKVLEAFADHWRFTPGFQTVRFLEVPEPATRIAMIKTGEADLVQVGVVDLGRVADTPGIRLISSENSNRRGVNVWFQGLLYATKDLEGNPIERPPPATHRPWVGAADDPADLERASKFRRAISLAIDREALNDVFLSGTGCKYIIMKMDNCNPFFQERWDYDFDLDMAKQYLVEADAEGATVQLAIPSGLGSTHSEISEALAPMWEAAGLKVDITKAAYSALRPGMLARESDMLFTFIWGNSTDLCSLPNSPGVQHSFNPVMEFDKSSENYLLCRDIGDLQRQWDILEPYYDWWWENHWAIGTVTWDTFWPIGPRVAEWALGPGATTYPNWIHTAVPVR